MIKNPVILIKEIIDPYIKRNFENLTKYFDEQNQMLDFKHLEFSTTNAQTNLKVRHALGFIPKDIIKLKVVGSGSLTFNYASFDNQYLDVTTTGPVRVRCFVGTWKGDTAAASDVAGDTETVLASPIVTASVPTGGIMTYGGTAGTAPSGFLACLGTEVSRSTYAALFAAIGTRYGVGDGSSTFKLPTVTDGIIKT